MVTHDSKNNRLIITGQWNLNEGANIIRQIEELTSSITETDVILDFSSLEYMDSSGISDMIQLNIRLRGTGKKLKIYQPSSLIKTTLKLVKVDMVIPIID